MNNEPSILKISLTSNLYLTSKIRKMDLEARSLPPSVKAALLAKLREYKTDLNNLKSEVKRITSANAQAARDDLLESGMANTLTVLICPVSSIIVVSHLFSSACKESCFLILRLDSFLFFPKALPKFYDDDIHPGYVTAF